MRRADELETARAADLGKVGVFAQEAVAGMNRLGVGHLGGGDDPRPVQVAVGAGGLADADRAIGLGEIGRIAVGLRVDRDDLDVRAPCRRGSLAVRSRRGWPPGSVETSANVTSV